MSVHPIPGTGTPAQPVPNPGASTSLLHLLDRTLGDNERTTNLKDLLTTGSKAISRIVLSVGIVLVAAIALAVIMIHFTELGLVISGIALGGTGTACLARSLWTRHKAKTAGKQTPTPRRR